MPVSILDVMPTLRALSGDPVDDREQGISLLPYILGTADPENRRNLFGEVSYRFSAPPHDAKTAFKTSLLSGSDKLIHDLPTDTWELYDLATDPEEQDNLAGRGHSIEKALKRRLLEWEASRQPAPDGPGSRSFEPNSADIERLRDLGYLR